MRASGRWALWGLLGALAIVAGACLLVAMALSTAWGKRLVTDWVVERVNQALPGRIAVQRLEKLTFSEVVLDGVSLRARAGDELIHVEEVRLEVALWPLLHGEIVVPALAVQHATVDLRFPNDPEHGLLAALKGPADPDATSEPPSIRVEHLGLRGIDLRLPPIPGVGQVDLRGLELDASIALGARGAIELQRSVARLGRDETPLGELAIRGRINDAGQRSSLELRGNIGGCEIALDGSATYSRGSELGRVPIQLDGRFSELTAETLARLLAQAELRQLFLGSVNGELRARGSPADLGASLSLATRAGVIDLDSRLHRFTELELTLKAKQLGLARLFEGAPDWRFTTSATLLAKHLRERPGARLQLRAISALNESPLPPLTLEAELLGQKLSALELRLEDAKTSLRVSGTGSLSGEARLAIDADLDAASFLPLAAALGSPLPDTLGRVGGKLSLTRDAGGQVSGSGALHGSGTFRRRPWSLEVPTAELSESNIRLPRATLTFAGQRLTLSGQYSPAASQLMLRLVDVDLERLLEPFEPGVALQGRFNAWASAKLDPPRGTFELESHVQGHPSGAEQPLGELALVVHAQSRFKPGAGWETTWIQGSHQAKLEVSRLTSDALSALIGRALPVRFDVAGQLSLFMARGAPVARWTVEGELGPPAASKKNGSTTQPTPQRLTHTGAYEGDRLQTRLGLADGQGEWLSIDGELAWPNDEAPGASVFGRLDHLPTLEHASELLERASWRLHLKSAPRSIEQLPVAVNLAGIRAAVVSAQLDFEKPPHREPRGTLYTEIRDVKTLYGSGECSSGAVVGRARMKLEDARFRAELSATDAERELLRVGAQGGIELLQLTRAELPRVTDLELTASSQRLPLAQLPFICERLRGLLDAQGRLQLSGPNPRGQLEVQIDGFSRGSDETLDLAVSLEGTETELGLEGQLTAGGKTSSMVARLALARRAGTLGVDPEAPLDVTLRLEQLPLAPFTASDGPISYASGSLSGALKVGGRAVAPALDGKLTLNDIAFTVSSIQQPLSDINGELVFDDGEVLMKDLSARDAGGQLTVKGSLHVRGPRSLDGVIDLVARDFPLRQAGQVVATTSASAQLTARLRGNESTLKIDLRDFDAWLEGGKVQKGLALSPHPDLVIDGAPNTSTEQGRKDGERAPPASAEAAPTRELTLHLHADKNLLVRRADFDLSLSTELSIVVESDAAGGESKLKVNGHVELERGHLDLLGRPFEIKPGGTLRFSGTPVPMVALAALYVDRRSDQKVQAYLSGSASSPHIDFSIDGEGATAAEALQAIYGGPEESEDDTEMDAEVQAEHMLAAVTAGILTNSLRKKLGAVAPIVSVAPTDDDDAAAVRAGFELDTLIPDFLRDIVTGIYIEGSVSTDEGDALSDGQDTQREALIELHFPHDLVTIGRHGPGATWSLDLGWRPGPF